MSLSDHLSKSNLEKLVLLKENHDKKNETKVEQNTKKLAKKNKPKKPKIKVELKDPIEELILIRTKLEEILINNNGSLMWHKMANSYQDKIQQLINVIVKKCFLDDYTFSDITVLHEEDQKCIIDKAGLYFEKKRNIDLITLDSDIEEESNPLEKFKNICEAFYNDGVLTIKEQEDLLKEQITLGISDEDAAQIISKIQLSKEKYKLGDLILNIFKNSKEFELDIYSLTHQLIEKYSLDINEEDVKRNINQVLFKHVNYNSLEDKYALCNEKNSQSKPIKSFKIKDKTYDVYFVNRSVNDPVLMLDADPIKNNCIIMINKESYIFSTQLENTHIINNLIIDGVVQQLLQLKNQSNINHRSHIELKEKILGAYWDTFFTK